MAIINPNIIDPPQFGSCAMGVEFGKNNRKVAMCRPVPMLTVKGDSMTTSILKIRGIGQATAPLLSEFGFKTAEDLAAASVEQLALVPGFGALRAQSTIADALSLLGGGVKADKKADKASKKGKDSKKKKKDKKNKKEKGGDRKTSSSKKKAKGEKKRKKGKNKRKK